jgi:glycosyltransferase involved in cell wall biosynthesis
MRIGVDATCWLNNRGYGRHARSLLAALVRGDTRNQYVFFIDSPDAIPLLPERVEVRQVCTSAPANVSASANGRRRLADIWRMGRALSRANCDVLLFPTVYTYVPTVSRAKKLVMVHDIIAETFPELTLPRRTARYLWKAKVGLSMFQADALITVSDYSRAGIQRHFKVAPQQLFVVSEASDPIFRRLENPEMTEALRACGVPARGRLITYVGGFGPHKNIDALVAAFGALARKFNDIALVLVGEYRNEVFHTAYQEIRAQVDRLGAGARVIFTGYLADEDLVVLLNRSFALALPSLMEGFGLPAVEAAACGCPVVATKESPLPSLLGGAGIFIEPERAALENALETMLSNHALWNHMRPAALAAAARLSWDAAAAQMMAVIEQVAAQ